jgi:uncharacterized protein involved in response to NO
LLFGMGGAAVGGYLLTALPAWTGGGGVSPRTLQALTLLWLTARLSAIKVLPVWLLLPLGSGYFALLAVVLAHALLTAGAWSRLWSVAAVAALGLGSAAFQAGMLSASMVPAAMVFLFALLIGGIGGRAVPAFTRSWLQKEAPLHQLRDRRLLSLMAQAATALGGGLVLAGQETPAGICLLTAGTIQGLRLASWHPLSARRYPALSLLHLAWAWLPIGLILMGTALLRPDLLPPATALHALTMGAMGMMILAISGRAAMERRGGRLMVGRGLAVAFILIWLATALRVLAPFLIGIGTDPIMASAALWIAGWAAYLWALRPALQGEPAWPVFSARRE